MRDLGLNFDRASELVVGAEVLTSAVIPHQGLEELREMGIGTGGYLTNQERHRIAVPLDPETVEHDSQLSRS